MNRPADAYPVLNFPPPQPPLRRRETARGCEVWDGVRGVWLVLTPEEWVRRHLIAWLTGRGVVAQSIVQEYPVPLNGQPQRADVVVMDRRAQPALLAECKAPSVRITQQTLAQAVRYNSVVGARFVMLTNGLTHYLYRVEQGRCLPCSPDDLDLF